MVDVDREPNGSDHGATLVVGTGQDPPVNAGEVDADQLVVLAFQNHEEWLDAVYSDPDGGPDALVCAGEMLRSAAATVATEDAFGPTVVDVPSAEDLGAIAMEVANIIDECRSANDTVTVVVDGLDVVLEAVDVERTFRLIHVLRGHVRAGEDDLIAYLDPEGVDEETRRVLEPLFDRVVTATESAVDHRGQVDL